MVLDVFGYPIDFVLGLVDLNLWIGAGYGVDLAALLFFFEDGAFADAH